jgi:multiple sugar transport system permease protein
MLAPALAVFALLLVYPVGYVLYHSLFEMDAVLGTGGFVGLDNFRTLFADPTFVHSVGVTLVFVAADLVLQLVLGLALALFAAHALGDRARGRFVTAMLLPAIVAPVVVGLYFKVIFDAESGVLNWALGSVGIPSIPWLSDPHWAVVAIVLASTWSGAPMCFLILLGGLLNIPNDVHEAAALDGAGRVRRLRSITLPILAPVITIALILRFADVFNLFDKIFVLTGGGPGTATDTIPLHLYRLAFRDLDLGQADALAVVMLAVQILVGVGLLASSRRRQEAT